MKSIKPKSVAERKVLKAYGQIGLHIWRDLERKKGENLLERYAKQGVSVAKTVEVLEKMEKDGAIKR